MDQVGSGSGVTEYKAGARAVHDGKELPHAQPTVSQGLAGGLQASPGFIFSLGHRGCCWGIVGSLRAASVHGDRYPSWGVSWAT